MIAIFCASPYEWLQFRQHQKNRQHDTVVSTTTTHACLLPSRLASGDYYKHCGKAPKWWGSFNKAETMVGKVKVQSPHRWESHNKSYSKLHHACVPFAFCHQLEFYWKDVLCNLVTKAKEKRDMRGMFAFLNFPLHSEKFLKI